jgi:membrane-associated phospholipid phosphatase
MKNLIASLYKRWLSPAGYLGLHLVIGFAIAVLGGYFFAETADEVFFETHPFLQMDASARDIVQTINRPGITALMKGITLIGNPLTVGVLSLAVGVFLFVRHSRRRLYAFIATMAGGTILNFVLKDAFHRARPTEVVHLVSAGGYSFPSGHSMGSILFFGGLAYVLFFSTEKNFWQRLTAVLFCFITVLMIGFSRVYLGVHYLSDVVAGYTAGLCWLGICITGTEAWVRLRNRQTGPKSFNSTTNGPAG